MPQQSPALTGTMHIALLSVMTFASADGHEFEVLEGDDGRLVVTVDGELPHSFTAVDDDREDPDRPARDPFDVLADDELN